MIFWHRRQDARCLLKKLNTKNIIKLNLYLLAALFLLRPVIPALLLEVLPVKAVATCFFRILQEMQIIILFVNHAF